MDRLMPLVLLVALLLSQSKSVQCYCQKSYAIICHTLDEIYKNNTENWRIVVIGSWKNASSAPSGSLDQSTLRLLRNVEDLTIIAQINKLNLKTSSSPKSKLKHINLYKNNLNSIGGGIFTNLNHLRRVHLADNNIARLGKNLFSPRSKLEIVNLSHNKLKRFEFSPDAAIDNLDLSHNEIEFCDDFKLPKHLHVLNLGHNKMRLFSMKCVEILQDLEELRLNHNGIMLPPARISLPRLTLLDLSQSFISYMKLSIFDDMPNLKVLDLSQSFLTYFYTHSDLPKRDGLVIHLGFNDLTSLDLEGDLKFDGLTLYGNPLPCQCLAKIFSRWSHNMTNSRCDKELFGAGLLPVCINIEKRNLFGQCPVNDTSRYISGKYYNRFFGLIAQSKEHISCQSFPKLYETLEYILDRKRALQWLEDDSLVNYWQNSNL